MNNNWAGNYTYGAAALHRPESVEQVQEIVRRSSRVRALGTRHSFNGIADTTGDLISMEHLDKVIALDPARRTVMVEGGTKYGQLGAYLARGGWALPNLASLPHISVAGACATATHGSGVGNGNLATAVAGMELVTAGGEVVECSRDVQGERFDGMVVGLGGLGVVTKLTLDLVPSFEMRQDVYENLSLAQAREEFETIAASGYSVSLFTDWRAENFNQVWLKRRVTDEAPIPPEPTFFGATLASADRHPIPTMSAENCTPQMGVAGPWHERLPHFRMDFTPSSGEELQSEYYVPRRHAVAALEAIAGLRKGIAPRLQISEVRTIAADGLWMSPCYREPSVTIHFTWVKDWDAVREVLPTIEQVIEPFDARPHWGKLFTMAPERVRSLYPRLPDFINVLEAYDPQGKFRNAFLDAYIFGRD